MAVDLARAMHGALVGIVCGCGLGFGAGVHGLGLGRLQAPGVELLARSVSVDFDHTAKLKLHGNGQISKLTETPTPLALAPIWTYSQLMSDGLRHVTVLALNFIHPWLGPGFRVRDVHDRRGCDWAIEMKNTFGWDAAENLLLERQVELPTCPACAALLDLALELRGSR